MTEAEWLACDDPYAMLELLGEPLARRRALLLGIACFELVRSTHWPGDAEPDPGDWQRGDWTSGLAECLAAVRVAERAADGLAEADEVAAALARVDHLDRVNHGPFMSLTVVEAVGMAQGILAGEEVVVGFGLHSDDNATRATAGFIRDIFGNPFRPAPSPLRRAWLTANVTALALTAYDERAFDRLPILADALEDAGAMGDILTHLRDPGPHVRGCWALDLVLGKR